MCVLDHSTIAAVDKFGNVFVLRVPDDANEDVEVGGSSAGGGNAAMWDQGLLNGAPNKLELLTHYYLGMQHVMF